MVDTLTTSNFNFSFQESVYHGKVRDVYYLKNNLVVMVASDRGLILVDTKYEFGKTNNGDIVLIDEIHTPDSSRYFYKEGYKERQDSNKPQKQLSKEFVRQWLISNHFQGLEGQRVPEMSDDYVNSVSERYVELYENITSEKFLKSDSKNISQRIFDNTENYLKEYFDH